MIKVNYLIQVIACPDDLELASKDVDSEVYPTYQIYQILLKSNLLWRICSIDEYNNYWVEVNFINKQGEAEFHTIVLDEDTYIKIEVDDYYVLDCME